MREYVKAPQSGKWDTVPDGEDYLARTVHEREELIDIGILDSAGNKVMARQRMDPIGYVRFPIKS